MGKVRRSRIDRPSTRMARVTERDLELLRALGRMRLATTSQIKRLFFAEENEGSWPRAGAASATGAANSSARHPRPKGYTATTKRLAKLNSLGLLRVHVLDLNTENLYGLTEKGRTLLVAEGMSADELHVQRSILREDAHLVAVNDVRVALVLALRSRPDVRVEFFFADHDLKRQVLQEHRKLPRYLPDALIQIVPAGAESLSLVLELDLGSEHRKQFAPKVVTTVEHARAGRPLWGLPRFRPLLLAEGESRLRYLAEVIVKGGGGELWLLADLENFLRSPFGMVVTSAAAVAATPATQPPVWPWALVPPKGG